MVGVPQRCHDEENYSRMVDGQVRLARHAVSCQPKREGMYMGAGNLNERHGGRGRPSQGRLEPPATASSSLREWQ